MRGEFFRSLLQRRLARLLMLAFLWIDPSFAAVSEPDQTAKQVTIHVETSEGAISIVLNRAAAPKVVDWLLSIVDRGEFDGTAFYRVGHLAGEQVGPQFVEGGVLSPFLLGEVDRQPTTALEAGVPTLRDWETTAESGLRHRRGAVTLGRDIVGDGSVVPELVVLLKDVPGMDHGGGRSPGNLGFPVIGYVASGMPIIEGLQNQARDRQTYFPFLMGQILREPLRINRIRRAVSP